MKPGHITLLLFLIYFFSSIAFYAIGHYNGKKTINSSPTVIVDTSLIINPEIDAMLVSMQIKKAENLRLIKQRDSLQTLLNKKYETKIIYLPGFDTINVPVIFREWAANKVN